MATLLKPSPPSDLEEVSSDSALEYYAKHTAQIEVKTANIRYVKRTHKRGRNIAAETFHVSLFARTENICCENCWASEKQKMILTFSETFKHCVSARNVAIACYRGNIVCTFSGSLIYIFSFLLFMHVTYIR